MGTGLRNVKIFFFRKELIQREKKLRIQRNRLDLKRLEYEMSAR